MSAPRWTPEVKPSADTGVPITVTQWEDPAMALLLSGPTSTPTVYRRGCYICEDPEFAQMGLPLCRACPDCRADPSRPGQGHIAADDDVCDVCGFSDGPEGC